MGTEESIFTIMVYRHPELIGYSEIEENGLIGKFFEDLKNTEVKVKVEKNANFNPQRSAAGRQYCLRYFYRFR